MCLYFTVIVVDLVPSAINFNLFLVPITANKVTNHCQKVKLQLDNFYPLNILMFPVENQCWPSGCKILLPHL